MPTSFSVRLFGAITVVLTLLMTSVVGAAPMPRLRDRTKAVGLDHPRTGTWSNVWFDHDRNGFPDVFIGRHGGWPLFYANRGGTYKRLWLDFMSPPGYRSLDSDTDVDRHSCAWGEATGDGRPDLYCTIGANDGRGRGPNQLLKRTDSGLRDIARRYGVRDIYGRGRSVNWIDHDTDGDLDLFVGNWSRAGNPNGMFVNRRGSFVERRVGVEDFLRTISSSWADWDRDGDPDLLVMQYRASTVAYENRGGQFARVSLPPITGGNWHSATWGDFDGNGYPDVHLIDEKRSMVLSNGRGSFRVVDSRPVAQGRSGAWFDLENDGDLDLFVVTGAAGVMPSDASVNRPDLLLVNRSRGFVPFRRRSFRGPTVGNGDSVTVADHDRDGREDMLVTNGYYGYATWRGKTQLLANRTEARNWVAVDLMGTRWNPAGFGASITVTTQDRRYHRQLNDGVAFRSQSEVGHIHLGIGAALHAYVRVAWPGGETDCLRIAHGQSQQLQMGTRPCRRAR